MDEYPELIQPENLARPGSWSGSKTPVFLFHDGGGTTFAYHCLDPIGRFVYGMRYPYFYDGGKKRFEGGMADMAAQYITWLKETVVKAPDFPARRADGARPVDVLLGGWSLGGLTSLEMARQLVGDADIRVKGILMIDCEHPAATGGGGGEKEEETEKKEGAGDGEEITAAGGSKVEILAAQAMRVTYRMLRAWDMPRWEGELAGKRPPTVLIRAREKVLSADWRDENRADRNLGWSGYDGDMFLDVLDVDGDHFSIFDYEYISGITAAIDEALAKLDTPTDGGDLWQ